MCHWQSLGGCQNVSREEGHVTEEWVGLGLGKVNMEYKADCY